MKPYKFSINIAIFVVCKVVVAWFFKPHNSLTKEWTDFGRLRIQTYFSSSGKSSDSLKTAIQIAGTNSSITSTKQREAVNALGHAALPKNPKGKR